MVSFGGLFNHACIEHLHGYLALCNRPNFGQIYIASNVQIDELCHSAHCNVVTEVWITPADFLKAMYINLQLSYFKVDM